MDSERAPQSQRETTPIFDAYRRGYEPEQVDRFVADQQRRLDETLNRATEAERRLAAAVGQLRELHRRVGVLEAEGQAANIPKPQPQPLDTLGERVQRILQEAWEGAHAIRQSAEEEAIEIRQRTLREAEDVVAMARQKAKVIEDEIDRRRRAYLGRIEEERNKAVAQITYLHEERLSVVGDLVRMKDAIESTVGKVATLKKASGQAAAVSDAAPQPRRETNPAAVKPAVSILDQGEERPRTVRDVAPRTMPVVHLNINEPIDAPDPSELVRSHRASIDSDPNGSAVIRNIREQEAEEHAAGVFDFDQE